MSLSGRCLPLRRLIGLLLFLMCTASTVQATPSALQQYDRDRYPAWQHALVRGVVQEVFAQASPADQSEAAREVLTFFHVVYHPTASHHFENNVAVMRQWRSRLGDTCERFLVPVPMAEAILTWENSGSTAATSFAACVGMGQLSMGAAARAHDYFRDLSVRGDRMISVLYDLAAWTLGRWLGNSYLPVRHLQSFARQLRTVGADTDLGRLHRGEALSAGVKDERMVPSCNIEDSVLFMRYLLDMYGDRADLAISAYHNGVGNTDDLLRDWLRRNSKTAVAFTFTERQSLYDALDKYHISFLTLWKDRRSREMLNGLRTMDGVPTTSANAREALGDESDIYLWKTLAAAAGLRASPERLEALIARYRHPQDEAETLGFVDPRLIALPGGIRIAPEMRVYLRSLHARFRERTGKACPLKVVLDHDTPTHRNGLALDLAYHHPVLDALLREDWLFDRIYRRRLPNGHVHICLNPRFAAVDEAPRSGAKPAKGPASRPH